MVIDMYPVNYVKISLKLKFNLFVEVLIISQYYKFINMKIFYIPN